MNLPTSLPSERDISLARDVSLLLKHAQTDTLTITIEQIDGSERQIQLPTLAIAALNDIMTAIGEGKAIGIVGINPELTIQSAADLLNVSPSYPIGLLETDRIPHRKIGNICQIKYNDVIEYKTTIDAARREVLDELTAEAQALNLGY
jgi:excisionase family DNA binding protein